MKKIKRPVPELRRLMRALTREEKRQLADAAETKVMYLYHLSGGHRTASPGLAQRLEHASHGAVTRGQLRPDVYAAD